MCGKRDGVGGGGKGQTKTRGRHEEGQQMGAGRPRGRDYRGGRGVREGAGAREGQLLLAKAGARWRTEGARDAAPSPAGSNVGGIQRDSTDEPVREKTNTTNDEGQRWAERAGVLDWKDRQRVNTEYRVGKVTAALPVPTHGNAEHSGRWATAAGGPMDVRTGSISEQAGETGWGRGGWRENTYVRECRQW